MAKVVIGLGTSHSPILNMEPPVWRVRGEIDDKTRMPLRDFEGNKVTFDELLEKVRPGVAEEIEIEKINARHEANQRGIAAIRDALYEARPDVVVMFGDDHHEVYKDDNMPPLAVYWGDTFPYRPTGFMKWPYDPKFRSDLWYWDEPKDFPVQSDLGLHLIESLMADSFDPAHSKYYKDGQGMSHSYAFVYRRILTQGMIPTVPIHLNTYFPPNQIPPRRCYELGRAVRRAIESWDKNLRVAILASGGLSHFVVDEELDTEFLNVLRSKNIERHAALPLHKLNAGNSELRNWIALAGAVDDLDMELFDYVPCYRSPAGTGCAMAFARWT